jgi:hypothetical protein
MYSAHETYDCAVVQKWEQSARGLRSSASCRAQFARLGPALDGSWKSGHLLFNRADEILTIFLFSL